jgi:hypothetical protein
MTLLNTTPQNADLFTRYMIDGFDEHEHIAVSTVWLPFFGDPATGGKTLFSPDRNVVDIDIKKANEKYAKMRMRGVGSQTLGTLIKGLKNEKYTSISRTYPLMEDFHVITADQLNQRAFNDNPYMDATKQQRLRKLAVSGSNEIIRRFVRSFNLLARESIIDGQMSAIFGTVNSDLIYDMYRHPDLTMTVTNAWDTGAGDVMGDLDTICQRVQRLGKVPPDAFFTKGAVTTAMMENTAFGALADNRRFNLIGMGSSDRLGENPISSMPPRYQKFVDAGWNYKGWVQTSEGYMIHVFVTPDYVEEDSGTFTDQVPDGYGIVCNTSVRCDRYFGPDEKMPIIPMRQEMYRQLLGIDLMIPSIPPMIKNAGALIRPDMFYYDIFGNENWTNVTVQVQAAPIFVTTHTDAFATLKGLTS